MPDWGHQVSVLFRLFGPLWERSGPSPQPKASARDNLLRPGQNLRKEHG